MRQLFLFLLLVLCFLTAAQSQSTDFPIRWIHLEGVDVDFDQETLVKTASSKWGNGGAFSQNVLLSGSEGVLKYTVGSNLNSIKVFGLSDRDNDAYQKSIDFAFYLYNGRLYILINGSIKGSYGRYQANEILEIKKSNNYGMMFYRNGKLIKRISLTSTQNTKNYYADCAIYTHNATFNGMRASFNSGHPILWENTVGVVRSYPKETLYKTASSLWGNGGAFSDNVLESPTNGYVAYVIDNDPNCTKAFGLSAVDVDTYQKSIDFAFYLHKSYLYILKSGKIIGSFGKYRNNEELKINKDSKYGIMFYRNGKLLKRISLSTSQKNLDYHVDCAIFTYDSHFNHVRASFDHSVYAYTVSEDIDGQTNGYVKLKVSGGIEPYSFFWGENWVSEATYNTIADSIPDSLNFSLPPYADLFLTNQKVVMNNVSNSYNYEVIDAQNEHYTNKAYLTDKLNIYKSTGASFVSDVIKRTSATGASFESCFENGLLSGEESFIEFSVSNDQGTYRVGYRVSDGTNQSGQQIKFGVEIKNKQIYLINDGVVGAALSSVSFRDIVAVSLENGQISLLKNNEILINEIIANLNQKLLFDVYIGSYNDDVSLTRKLIKQNYKNPSIKINDVLCDEPNNSGGIQVINFPFYLNNYYQLLNEEGVVITNFNNSGLFNNLTPGVYTIDAYLGANNTLYSYTVDIAYNIQWEPESPDLTYEVIPDNIISQQSGINISPAKNYLPEQVGGWVEFKIKDFINQPVNFGTYVVFGLTTEETNTQAKFLAFNFLGLPFIMPYSTYAGQNYQSNPVFYSLINTPNIGKLRVKRTETGFDYTLIETNNIQPVGVNSSFPLVGEPTPQLESMSPFALLFNQSKIVKGRASFSCERPKPIYAHLLKDLDGGYYKSRDNKVYFEFVEEYYKEPSDILTYNIYMNNINVATNTEMVNDVLETVDIIKVGINLYSIDITSLESGYYILEVINSKNEKKYLRFKA